MMSEHLFSNLNTTEKAQHELKSNELLLPNDFIIGGPTPLGAIDNIEASKRRYELSLDEEDIIADITEDPLLIKLGVATDMGIILRGRSGRRLYHAMSMLSPRQESLYPDTQIPDGISERVMDGSASQLDVLSYSFSKGTASGELDHVTHALRPERLEHVASMKNNIYSLLQDAQVIDSAFNTHFMDLIPSDLSYVKTREELDLLSDIVEYSEYTTGVVVFMPARVNCSVASFKPIEKIYLSDISSGEPPKTVEGGILTIKKKSTYGRIGDMLIQSRETFSIIPGNGIKNIDPEVFARIMNTPFDLGGEWRNSINNDREFMQQLNKLDLSLPTTESNLIFPLSTTFYARNLRAEQERLS